MKMLRNRYVKSSKLSEAQFRAFIKLVAADLAASQIAQVSGLNRNTVNRLLGLLRLRMTDWCAGQSPFSGIVGADESYFGPRRVKGMTGRGAGRMTIVFGIFERGGKVWCKVVLDVSMRALQRVILERVDPAPVINTDRWRSYNRLGEVGHAHVRVDHGRDEFARGEVHINGIEAFWGYAKTRLARFRGLSPKTFPLHLKECEFRYNNRGHNLMRLILKICRENPLS
jgi:transposase